MKLLTLRTNDPHWNLAVEEALFRYSDESVFLLWQNAPTVVIGRNQNAYAEVDLDYAAQNGITLARRITGGGAVYHDAGNLNYSYLSNHDPQAGTDFDTFTRPIREALASLGVSARLSGRNDLEVDGKKISGSAQHAANGRILHHGTLLFDSELDVLSRVLRVNADKLASKAIPSVRARVTNLKPLLPTIPDVTALAACIERFLMDHYHAEPLSLPEDARIRELFERNRSREWLLPQRELLSRYSLTRRRRFPFGSVELLLDMKGELLQAIRIQGDFFGSLPIEDLENRLAGTTLSEAAKALSSCDLNPYVNGMQGDELASLLLGKD